MHHFAKLNLHIYGNMDGNDVLCESTLYDEYKAFCNICDIY